METMEINGETWVRESDARLREGGHVCVIADRGWIFEGREVEGGGGVRLTDAHVVRKWSNGLGIGGLADPEHKGDYTLDFVGDIEVAERAVIATIPLGW